MMRRGGLPVRVAAGLAAWLLAGLAAAEILVTGGTVHTLVGEPVQADVLVRDGRIVAVGEALEAAPDAERLDATGKVLTPGLIDSHTRLGLQEIELEPSTMDAMLVDGYGPAFDVQWAINPASTLFAVNRIAGVTRAVTAPDPGHDPLAGWGAAIRLTDANALLRARVAMFGALTAGSGVYVGGSRSAVIGRLRTALAEAARYQPRRFEPTKHGYDHEDMAALKTLLSEKKPLAMRVDRATEIRALVRLAGEFDLPLVLLGGAEAWQVADVLAASETAVVIGALQNLPLDFERLGARLDNAARLHEAGVKIALTFEESQNARLLRQLAGNAVANGLPWPAALAAITRNPAEIWGFADAGVLQPGAVADLVVWNGDPLELTTWAEAVMIDGEWQAMRSRQTRLYERYRDLEAEAPPAYR